MRRSRIVFGALLIALLSAPLVVLATDPTVSPIGPTKPEPGKIVPVVAFDNGEVCVVEYQTQLQQCLYREVLFYTDMNGNGELDKYDTVNWTWTRRCR